MFCSNCGNQLREGLKYCNRCGVRSTGELEKIGAAMESNKLAQTLSIATGWIGFGGLVALAIMIGNLLRLENISPRAVFLVVIFGAIVFGLVFLLLRQISALSNKIPFQVLPGSQTVQEAFPSKSETVRLEAPREPVLSVTENTTRTLENNSER
jgi:hypothetical protein